MITSILSHLNWLHIVIATLGYFMLGALWYSFLFSKQWTAGHKIDINAQEASKGIAKIFFLSFIFMFINVTAIAIIQYSLGCVNLMAGLKVGLLLGLCFNGFGISINYIYLKKPLSVFLIDAVYQTLGCGIAGAILGAWQ